MNSKPEAHFDTIPLRASVLIVDDQPANLLAIESILEPLGHRLVRAASGSEALRHVLWEEFAVILLDVRMPGVDGLETASLIKQKEHSRHVPIIFLSANDETSVETANVYRHGAVDFLRKPYNSDILRSKVSVFIDLFLRGEKIKQQEARLRRHEREQAARTEREAQQARIYSIFKQAPALIASLRGRTHVYDFANGPYLQLLEGGDPAGKPVRLAVPELGDHPFVEILDEVYSSGAPHTALELPVRLARHGDNGKEECFFNFVFQPTRDVAGQVEGILVHAVDVSQQVRAQAALRQSESKFRRVSESGMIGMIFANVEGAITDANDAFLTMLGYDRHDLEAGRLSWKDLTPAIWASVDEKAIEDLLAVGIARPHEKEYVCKDGRVLPVIVSAALLDSSRAELVGVILDNAERKRAEKERERLLQSLARSNEALDRFAYAASHDLKTPLRGIANLSEWLEEDLSAVLTDPARQKLNLLRGRVGRMEALIDGILNYSRAGRTGNEIKKVDVTALVTEVIELLAPASGVTIEIQAGLPVLQTEQASLQQVFMNLVGNALKHARRADPVVRVGVRDHGELYEFTVEDNGRGIAPAFHERIWGLFQTLDARDRVEGTGIGLSVVKKIVEARGGRAWVESAVGAGAAFHFTWPKREQAS